MSNPLIVVPLDQIPSLEAISDVPTDDLLKVYKMCAQMSDLCTKEHGIGLAAPQCGIPWRLFVAVRQKSYIEGHNTYDYFVNCDYTGVGDKQTSVEGCLSLRSKEKKIRYFEVERYNKIILLGHQLVVDPEMSLKPVYTEVEGLFAIVYQHEIDHAFSRDRMIDKIGKEIQIH